MPLYGRRKRLIDVLQTASACENDVLAMLSGGGSCGPSEICEFDASTGLAPLHVAVEKGFERVVTKLLSLGCKFDSTVFGGLSPAFIAVTYGRTQILKALLDARCPLDSSAVISQMTVLHLAAARCDVPATKLILERINADAKLQPAPQTSSTTSTGSGSGSGSDPGYFFRDVCASNTRTATGGGMLNARTSEGLTPLALAAEHSSAAGCECVALLLEAGADPTLVAADGFSTAASRAAASGATLALAMIAAHAPSVLHAPAARGGSILHAAALASSRGCIDFLFALFRQQQEEQQHLCGGSSLDVQAPSEASVSAFASASASSSSSPSGSASASSPAPDANLIKELLSLAASAAVSAPAAATTEAVAALVLRSRAWQQLGQQQRPFRFELEVDAFDADGYTPAHLAAKFAHAHALRALLDAGADVCVYTEDGAQNTCAHLAAEEAAAACLDVVIGAAHALALRRQGVQSLCPDLSLQQPNPSQARSSSFSSSSSSSASSSSSTSSQRKRQSQAPFPACSEAELFGECRNAQGATPLALVTRCWYFACVQVLRAHGLLLQPRARADPAADGTRGGGGGEGGGSASASASGGAGAARAAAAAASAFRIPAALELEMLESSRGAYDALLHALYGVDQAPASAAAASASAPLGKEEQERLAQAAIARGADPSEAVKLAARLADLTLAAGDERAEEARRARDLADAERRATGACLLPFPRAGGHVGLFHMVVQYVGGPRDLFHTALY